MNELDRIFTGKMWTDDAKIACLNEAREIFNRDIVMNEQDMVDAMYFAELAKERKAENDELRKRVQELKEENDMLKEIAGYHHKSQWCKNCGILKAKDKEIGKLNSRKRG